ncbi:MAG TPA: helix-hairpin-helix domain-containing protein [Candidatus Acidoferrales bacterium]|nr:helix-hairpin-helix domain-containing protein [Candidatus Acidoferrales bacterium]
MRKNILQLCAFTALVIGLGTGMSSCYWTRSDQGSSASQDEQRQRDEKTRDEVAKATERMKPAIESAGRKLGEATEKAAEEAHAAAQGVAEGWQRGGHAPLDLNSATERELTELPGISGPEARKIIRSRPYTDKRELVTRSVLPRSAYTRIEDQVTAK